MPTPYYTPSGNPINQSRALAQVVRQEFSLIETGLTEAQTAILLRATLAQMASMVGPFTPTLVLVTDVTVTMVAGSHYVLSNVLATSAYLPPAPAAGDMCWITPVNDLRTNQVMCNTGLIMSGSSDLVMDLPYETYALRCINAATKNWRLL